MKKNLLLTILLLLPLMANAAEVMIHGLWYNLNPNEKTAEVIRSWGLEPVVGPNVGKVVDGRYAGTVAERVSDIRWALNDPSIKAIICNRGGYGTIQLIDQLTMAELKASPKWLVGFSDITTLHGLLTRAGVMSMHGTPPST